MTLPADRACTASIVINTLDRANHLVNALNSVLHLDYPEFEVVVVNGPSSDGTAELLEKWRPIIKIGRCDERNLSMSRNIGISLASGEIIAFIDDDAVVHPKWLKSLAPWFYDARTGAVGGYTIDNTGVSFQMCKAICDRYGNGYFPPEWFDERGLCVPGNPFYPSLLGTNSVFRTSALHEIGGFDETFAYFLDETDVCLRLVDHGYRIAFEGSALVYHQFASSHIRDSRRIPRTLYPSAISKSYFIMRHGTRFGIDRAAAELGRYEKEIRDANDWLARNGKIDQEHRFSLDQDLLRGIERGIKVAQRRIDLPQGHLRFPLEPTVFRYMIQPAGRLRICMISQGYPPQDDAGIAHWTWASAIKLAQRGHRVHVITKAPGSDESIRYENGVWLHQCSARDEAIQAVASRYKIPENIAEWSARVFREVQFIKSFGLDVVSFPIWDLEGLPCLDDADVAVVLSLHTTYALAEPFKPEWSARPLYKAFMVDRVIAAERNCLERAPVIHANSHSIIRDIERYYGLSITERSTVIPRGTHDIVELLSDRRGESTSERVAKIPWADLKVLCVGRFEPRKGFELAIGAAKCVVRENEHISFCFVGGELNVGARRLLAECGCPELGEHPRVSFAGIVSRRELDALYGECDVVLMPSRYESFGLVAIEAMSAGKPVIALQVGALPEIISNGINGIIVPDGADCVSAISTALRRLQVDPEWRDRLASAARKAFEEKFTLDIEMERTETLFRRAIAMHGEKHACV